MRRSLISAPVLAAAAGLGFLALAPSFGCGGGESGLFASSTTTGSGGAGGGTGGAGGQALSCVIDGNLGPSEACDDGNDVPGDGCEPDCTFTCTKGTKDDACDDADPCNGTETCSDEHVCVAGQPTADGTACGDAKICKGGVCGDDACGDAFVGSSEECDDGNATDGDGCDHDCTLSCTAADPAKCAPVDPCQGAAACDDATHTCAPLVPLADGEPCGQGAFCLAGACKLVSCGDGVVDPGEPCDDGNAIDADGCDTDCTFSCVDASADCAAPPACQTASCSAAHVCEVGPDAAQNGQACGNAGYTCLNGACAAPNAVCGNGVKEAGEDCDFGGANGAGTGCETNCTFSCTTSPDSCVDANPCNGVESCGQVTVNGHVGQKCSPGAPPAACSVCPGGLCVGNACKASSCGDGCLDANAGEQCEPPSTMTCDATCTTVVQAVCGNGVRDAGEQCDDGNTTNLDGCDASCHFEQDQRVNWLKMQFGTDAYCTANAIGAAFVGGTAQSQVQSSLDGGIADGSVTILLAALGLDDLTGASDPAVSLGVLHGSPQMGVGYDGTSDLDWWYTVDPLSIDASRSPLSSLTGSITAKTLNAGPGSVTLTLLLAGQPAPLEMSGTKLTASLGATSAPLASAGQTPGHLASEHLDPALVSFATAGQPNANGAAKLCGNVSAASLANVPIPASLTTGLSKCSQGYTVANSVLDLLIGGCNVFFTQQVKPTQPDKVDPSAPPAGTGGPYKLSANGQHSVATCKDASNATVPLATCLEAAAYSSSFKFATDRVIAK